MVRKSVVYEIATLSIAFFCLDKAFLRGWKWHVMLDFIKSLPQRRKKRKKEKRKPLRRRAARFVKVFRKNTTRRRRCGDFFENPQGLTLKKQQAEPA